MGEFHGLLFGDLRKPIDQPLEGGWVTHAGDLQKYIGYPAFLSLENEAGAWFELSEVRMSDREPPVEPHGWALDLLTTDCDSLGQFRLLAASKLLEAFADSWISQSSDATSVARAMLSHQPERLLGMELADLLQSLASEIQLCDQQTPLPTLLLAIEEGSPVKAAIQTRGNPHQLGETVSRSCLQWLPTWQSVDEGSSGRRELAQSLVDSRHPLVSRVLVNRVWHHLLGQGLVPSTDNFGVLGSRPSHPELLDWLASEFMQQGWSIKWLIRQIVTSQTYALGNKTEATLRERDPDGRLFSYRPVRRLTAENLRDAVLLTCGTLDSRLGGSSVPVFLTEQMTGRGRPQMSGPLDGQQRRSLFIEVRRNFLNPFFLVFDFPMPSTCTGRRNDSNLPSQALNLLNDPLMLEMSHRWALSTANIRDPQERIEQMIQVAFSRPATAAEVTACRRMVDDCDSSGWQSLAHTLLNAKAFYFVK